MLTKVRLRIKVSFVRVCYEILRFRYRCYSGNHDNPICWIHILLSLIKKKTIMNDFFNMDEWTIIFNLKGKSIINI